MRRTLKLAVQLSALALALPASALASGGPTPPPPVANPSPCATAVMTTGGGGPLLVGIERDVTFSYNVGNCSAAPETVTPSFSETGTSLGLNPIQVLPCEPATWSAPSLTIQPGSTQGFSTDVPKLVCPFDPQNDLVTATVTDPGGAGLATVDTSYTRTIAR